VRDGSSLRSTKHLARRVSSDALTMARAVATTARGAESLLLSLSSVSRGGTRGRPGPRRSAAARGRARGRRCPRCRPWRCVRDGVCGWAWALVGVVVGVLGVGGSMRRVGGGVDGADRRLAFFLPVRLGHQQQEPAGGKAQCSGEGEGEGEEDGWTVSQQEGRHMCWDGRCRRFALLTPQTPVLLLNNHPIQVPSGKRLARLAKESKASSSAAGASYDPLRANPFAALVDDWADEAGLTTPASRASTWTARPRAGGAAGSRRAPCGAPCRRRWSSAWTMK
jgi:hypothetical protein